MNIKLLTYRSDSISVFAYIIVVLISLFYAAKCYSSKNNPPVVVAYNVLFAVLCIYGALNLLIADVNTTYKHIPVDFYLQNIVKSMLPFYAFYGFAKEGLITRKWLCWFSVIFGVVAAGNYSYMQDALLWDADSSATGVTNNLGYVFVAFLPFVCFFKRRIIQYVFIGICSVFVILSMKRGAILDLGIVLLFYFFMITKQGNIKNITKWLTIILTVAFFVLAYRFVLILMDTNVYFMHRVEDTMEGYSSGRDDLFTFYWRLFWDDSNAFEYIWGRGADGTIHTGHNYAHNDWLEILINQGFLGIILFAMFWYHLFKVIRKKTTHNIIRISLGMCALSLFVKTFFSMSINDMSIFSTCILGVIIASYYNQEIALKITE